ncbi:MAG: hypothetical protein QXK37_00805 [Candidatus Woesearchaeota archaeon]
MNSTLIKNIRIGQETERKGIKFYSAALRKVEDINSKNLLKFLIKEEERHLVGFNLMLEKIKKDLGFDSKKALNKRPKIPLFSKTAYKKISKPKTEIYEIFTVALGMEREGIKLYTRLQRNIKNEEATTFLKDVVAQEKDHIRLINQHRESLHNYFYWEGVQQPRIES